MRIEAGPNAVSLNNGVIDVNGMAQALPRENIAMLAMDSGSGGVGNRGTLNLNGYNSTGLKVIATAGNQAHASSGAINVAGDADRFGGTNNTAVWVTGEPGGHASADITGPIRLSGKAGIGIRAEGRQQSTLAPAPFPPPAAATACWIADRSVSTVSARMRALICRPRARLREERHYFSRRAGSGF